MPKTVTVDSAGGAMKLYDSEPGDAPLGAVIVIQEAFGVTDYIQDVCNRLSAAGYRAVAPHLFHRSGDPVIAYDDMQDVMTHLGALSADGLAADIDATLLYLSAAGIGASQTGIVGFCMGGSVVVLAAARNALGAAVTFYGGGVTKGRFGMPPLAELAAQLQTPWLGLFGEDDQSIPADQVELLRDEAKKATVPTEVVNYPGAGHAFHTDGRDSYHEPSAADGWQRTLDWLGAHLERD
jgi:carboxymethylenebutenolidase